MDTMGKAMTNQEIQNYLIAYGRSVIKKEYPIDSLSIGEAADCVEILLKKMKPSSHTGDRSFPLTEKMKEAKAVVLTFKEDHGRAPSYQELADNLGVSKSTAYARMNHMRELMRSIQPRSKT